MRMILGSCAMLGVLVASAPSWADAKPVPAVPDLTRAPKPPTGTYRYHSTRLEGVRVPFAAVKDHLPPPNAKVIDRLWYTRTGPLGKWGPTELDRGEKTAMLIRGRFAGVGSPRLVRSVAMLPPKLLSPSEPYRWTDGEAEMKCLNCGKDAPWQRIANPLRFDGKPYFDKANIRDIASSSVLVKLGEKVYRVRINYEETAGHDAILPKPLK